MGSELNRQSYNAIAEQWCAARQAFFGREREYLDVFLDGMAKAAPILDFGCGTGRPISEAILAERYQVVGVDQAEHLLAYARRNLPDGRWVRARMEEFRFEGPYAGVVCWDSLFHVERRFHEEIFGKIAHSLLPGGRLMATFGGSTHPAFTDTMFGHEFFYDSFAPDHVLGLLEELGFVFRVSEFMNVPDGKRDKGRYAVVAELRNLG